MEIEKYAGGYTAKAKCQLNQSTPLLSKRSLGVGYHSLRAYRLPRKNNVKDARMFNGINRFLHTQMS